MQLDNIMVQKRAIVTFSATLRDATQQDAASFMGTDLFCNLGSYSVFSMIFARAAISVLEHLRKTICVTIFCFIAVDDICKVV